MIYGADLTFHQGDSIGLHVCFHGTLVRPKVIKNLLIDKVVNLSDFFQSFRSLLKYVKLLWLKYINIILVLFFKKNIYSIVEPFENYENFKHFFKT